MRTHVAPIARGVVTVLLVGAMIGVCGWYGGADLWEQPTPEDIARDPPPEGQSAFLFVEVVTIDHAERTALVVADDWTLQATELDPAVIERIEPGAKLQVAGTLWDVGRVMEVDRSVVDYPTRGTWWRVVLQSTLGIMLALAHCHRYWTLDATRGTLTPRGDGDG